MSRSISSHVLDTALGRPAAGLPVRLDVLDVTGWKTLGNAVTNADGRVPSFLPPDALEAGTYRVTFDTKAYFDASGTPSFYPQVDVVFVVARPEEHYHVPLLVSPFGYSTYRGS